MSREELNSKSMVMSDFDRDESSNSSDGRSASNITSQQCISENEDEVGAADVIKNRKIQASIRRLSVVNEFSDEGNSKVISPS